MTERAQFRISSWVFVRLLGGVYAIACASLWLQIEGLVGERGILPATRFLERAGALLGADRFWRLPTLGWIDAGDLSLTLLCAAGVALGLVALFGWLQLPALTLSWAIYLSLTILGQDFLGFQWDALLLEAGLLAIFLPGARWKPMRPLAIRPPRLAIWLLRLLTFKLMFSSGLVKLASGDPTWRALGALRVHYETQPLPNPGGWLAHQLPGFLQVTSVALLFFVELVLPFLIFGPAKWRRVGAGGLIALQLLIALTGNYAFFNVLSLGLCLLLLDDAWWMRFWSLLPPASEARALGPIRRVALLALAFVWLTVSGLQVARAAGIRTGGARPLVALQSAVAPFRSINGYGLFAVMTTTRHEIVIEGSDDGADWRVYEFRHKPGDPARMPPIVAPHQPRLDWQMWFAALRPPTASPWFVAFLSRLAQAEPSVLALLEHDPFAGRAPALLRARLERYEFGTISQLTNGAWWVRTPGEPFVPPTPSAELAELTR